MFSKDRLLHPATIIALVALVVALSGVGYAATKIGTSQLKNAAVTTPKIKNAAVNTAKLKNNAVNSAKLAGGAVAAADLGADAVTAAKIAGGAVGVSQIATGAVGAAKLASGSVTNEKLGPNAVTGPKIAGGTITAANIAPGQVVTGGGQLQGTRLILAPNTPNTTALAVPGIATLQLNCPADGHAAPTVTNTSGTELSSIRAALPSGLAPSVFNTTPVAPGASVTTPNTGSDGVQVTTWQLGYGSGPTAHVTTLTIVSGSIGFPSTGCTVSAQAVTTG